MTRSRSILLVFFLLAGCGKKFPDALAKAETAFAEKNYIDTVDILVNGLPTWKESDGNESKAHAYELLGKAYHQLHNTDKAIEAYKQAVPLSDSTFDSAYALGVLYTIRNQPELAKKSFLDALKKKPNDPMALLGLGNSNFAEKNLSAAKEAFQKVIDVSPGVKEALEQLSVINSRSMKKTYSLKLKPKAKPKKIIQRKKR